MRTIRATEILEYYDGIEIFSGVDEAGCKYLGLRSESAGDHDRYMVVEVRPERLREFRHCTLDLRDLMLESPAGAWYMTTADMDFGEPMALEAQKTPLRQSEFLPPADFTLDDSQEVEIEPASIGEPV